jgi:hypothetical protein
MKKSFKEWKALVQIFPDFILALCWRVLLLLTSGIAAGGSVLLLVPHQAHVGNKHFTLSSRS